MRQDEIRLLEEALKRFMHFKLALLRRAWGTRYVCRLSLCPLDMFLYTIVGRFTQIFESQQCLSEKLQKNLFFNMDFSSLKQF